MIFCIFQHGKTTDDRICQTSLCSKKALQRISNCVKWLFFPKAAAILPVSVCGLLMQQLISLFTDLINLIIFFFNQERHLFRLLSCDLFVQEIRKYPSQKTRYGKKNA